MLDDLSFVAISLSGPSRRNLSRPVDQRRCAYLSLGSKVVRGTANYNSRDSSDGERLSNDGERLSSNGERLRSDGERLPRLWGRANIELSESFALARSRVPEDPMARLSALIPFAVVASLAACASAGTSSRPRTSPDRITAAEIESSSASNAFDLISRLRPTWLRSTKIGSIGAGARGQVIVVYLDGHRLGDAQSLRSLSIAGLGSMEWLDAVRAAAVLSEIGSDPIAGAIVIKSR
jgi:hypothetical protein